MLYEYLPACCAHVRDTCVHMAMVHTCVCGRVGVLTSFVIPGIAVLVVVQLGLARLTQKKRVTSTEGRMDMIYYWQ